MSERCDVRGRDFFEKEKTVLFIYYLSIIYYIITYIIVTLAVVTRLRPEK